MESPYVLNLRILMEVLAFGFLNSPPLWGLQTWIVEFWAPLYVRSYNFEVHLGAALIPGSFQVRTVNESCPALLFGIFTQSRVRCTSKTSGSLIEGLVHNPGLLCGSCSSSPRDVSFHSASVFLRLSLSIIYLYIYTSIPLYIYLYIYMYLYIRICVYIYISCICLQTHINPMLW